MRAKLGACVQEANSWRRLTTCRSFRPSALIWRSMSACSSPDLTRNSHVRFSPLRRIGPLHAEIVPRSQPVALLHLRLRVLSFRPAPSGIFLAVDRCHMRRILIEIRSPDSKLLAVCIDPFPQVFSGYPSLRPGPAFDAHHIGRKPAAIPTDTIVDVPMAVAAIHPDDQARVAA